MPPLKFNQLVCGVVCIYGRVVCIKFNQFVHGVVFLCMTLKCF